MKYFRLSIAIGTLTMALTLPALAGEIHTGIASPLPPSATGEMQTTVAMEIALSLMQSVLALF